MRYLFGLVCALALGGVGCSQSLGPVGDGGAGGDGGNGGTGGTTGQEFPCTEQGIRDAIAEGGGPHTFDCNGSRTIVTESEIFIDNDVILDGEGQLTLDGDGEHPVFVSPANVNDPPPTAELRGFRITGAPDVFLMSTLYGVYVAGDAALTLRDCTVFENQGDGIRVDGGTLTLVDSSVSDNGNIGIVSQGGSLTIMNSTVSGNDTNVLSFTGPATLTMVNSTISGGEVGVSNFGQMSVRNSTIVSEGSAFETSDGDYDPPPQAVFTNTIVAGACQGDAPSYVTSGGHNIESPGDTCGFDPDGTDLVNVPDAMLGPLADNGGPTNTHALEAGSEALNKVPAEDCAVGADQRGEPRPETGGTMCDVGAFERQPDDR